MSLSLNQNESCYNCKIYKYSFTNKPTTNAIPWEFSQMYQIYHTEIPKSLKSLEYRVYGCLIYQTKLFLFDEHGFTQWNLLTMNFEMQYLLELPEDDDIYYSPNIPDIVINKTQTLLAISLNDKKKKREKKLIIFSMETGTQISSCGWY